MVYIAFNPLVEMKILLTVILDDRTRDTDVPVVKAPQVFGVFKDAKTVVYG